MYSLSTVVVIPSLWEGLPYVLLDAMVEGKAVVASRVGGIREIITRDNGVLVEPGDTGALVDALKSVLSDREWRDELGRNGRATVEKIYRLEDMVTKTENVYLDAVS